MARPKVRRGHTHSRTEIEARWRIEEAFEQFLRAKRLEQLKPRTLEDHRLHHQYFMRWLKAAYPNIRFADEIDTEVIRAYIDFMLTPCDKDIESESKQVGSSLSPVTVNVRLRTLKTFFRWLQSEGFICENPTTNIKLLRTELDTIQGFTAEQIALLLAQPDVNTYVGFRDYCLMLFLLDTGARIQETLATTRTNVDLVEHHVMFGARTTKTRKSRIVPISQKTANALKELIEENREHFGEKVEHIFVSVQGVPLDASTIRARLREYGKMAGIDKQCRVSPHTFRHTFARLYIRNGGDVFTLQRILGHSSMEMVRKYVQMEQSDLQEAHWKFSPLNSIKI
ncbi:tyrosine-type recombinase/integrase [Effusibacillus pohliae]|uniref:tyrosine-type recombinase/integrase n=1 Tax=Effusibacillus pohliae TaxID=232270 RepID=UPI0003A84254|nr:tyrosine-type recombinase/integrase [Effusibacillus pohliae]